MTQVWVHVVFSTKFRQPFLVSHSTRKRVHGFIASYLRDMENPTKIVGGTEDHVHILLNHSRKYPLMDVIQHVKQESSRWIKETFPDLPDFYWQSGYAAFSVCASQLGRVIKYIANQMEHHRKFDFRTELVALLDRYDIEYDEAYVLG